jgi:adenosylcobinamide kinase/adenosylcobinamide-phosphate guanylyltransferase
MTLWLANWLGKQGEIDFDAEPLVSARLNEEALQEIDALLDSLASLDSGKILLIVSNEVGLGVVPAYTIGRVYRDILGRINQRLAQHAERVYLMIAGLAVDIKRLNEDASL